MHSAGDSNSLLQSNSRSVAEGGNIHITQRTIKTPISIYLIFGVLLFMQLTTFFYFLYSGQAIRLEIYENNQAFQQTIEKVATRAALETIDRVLKDPSAG